MNAPANHDSENLPIIEPQLDATYTLDVVAQLTGVSSQTILFYREQGLVRTVETASTAGQHFDDEAVRAIRRLEHLRTELELKDPALKLMVNLLGEIERLREEVRTRR